MTKLNIAQTTVSDQTNTVSNFEVEPLNTDGALDQKETEWLNPRWSTYWSYFNTVPDLKNSIILKAIWDVGRGYTADSATEVILDHISGIGGESFDDFLFNAVVTMRIGGDFYGEIMWENAEKDTGKIINLKPLDTGKMKTIVNGKGIIIRYEQTTPFPKKGIMNRIKNFIGKGQVIKFRPRQIFHLMHNRLADQIHGISDIEGMEETIKADMESFADAKWASHHQARPMIVFKLGTDKQSEIDKFIKKMDEATDKGENVYVPDDQNTFSFEVVQVNMSQVMLEWRNDIRNRFYRNIGLPQVVPGAGGQGTESDSKVVVFAFEQIVAREQRFIEKAVWNQLFLKIKLVPPSSIKQDLQQDEAKDANQGLAFEPADTNVEKGA